MYDNDVPNPNPPNIAIDSVRGVPLTIPIIIHIKDNTAIMIFSVIIDINYPRSFNN